MLPFILVRGVALLGIDSVRLPIDRRRVVWRRLGDDLLPPAVDQLASTEVGLDALPEALSRVLAGDPRGRTLVRID